MVYRQEDEPLDCVTEKIAIDYADGFNFVGEECARMSVEAFNLKKPYSVLSSYPNKKYFKYKDWHRTGGLVYEGGVFIEGENPDFMRYADYREMGEKCKELGLPFRMYTPHYNEARKEKHFDPYYTETMTLPYNELIKNLGHYDWGLVGNIKAYNNWNVAIPNKMFEYMAGGIPVVAINAKQCEDFVTKNGVGISVKSVDELKDRWDERYECQINVIKNRFKWCMEAHIHELEDLYKELVV